MTNRQNGGDSSPLGEEKMTAIAADPVNTGLTRNPHLSLDSPLHVAHAT